MNEEQKPMNPIMAGVTGAAVGAGAALLTSKILSDKKMREKIMETAKNVRGAVASTIRMARKRAASPASFSHRIRIGRRSRRRG